MKEKRNIKREKNGGNEAINPEEEEKSSIARPLLLANARLAPVGFGRTRVFCFGERFYYTRVKMEARKNRRAEQLTPDYRKPKSIRLYLAQFFPSISNRPRLSRILRSFSASRQIRFCSFPLDLFVSVLGLLPFYCCSEIAKSQAENDR